MMAVNYTGIVNSFITYAELTGLFDSVNGHEPKSSPQNGLTAAVWMDSIQPLGAVSGLAQASGLLVIHHRMYVNMLKEPQDAIDPQLMDATDLLLTAYCGDFDVSSQVRNIDIFGAHSAGLNARAGYVTIDNKMFRAMTITIPMIINDLWVEVQ